MTFCVKVKAKGEDGRKSVSIGQTWVLLAGPAKHLSGILEEPLIKRSDWL